MKGLVFTELLDMAEAAAGEDVVDDVLDTCPLASGGAYTSVGNYQCSELLTLVGEFSRRTGLSVEDLQKQFGHWMLKRFVEGYSSFFDARTNAFDMLESIETEVHVEVRKLYPDTELPTFDTRRDGEDTLHFTYRSPRRLIAFCHGLIEGCLAHYGETASISCTDHSTDLEAVAEFRIVRTNG